MQIRARLCDPERSVPHQGKDYRFVCASEADNETTFACTGSEHRLEGVEILCDCPCHEAPVVVALPDSPIDGGG